MRIPSSKVVEEFCAKSGFSEKDLKGPERSRRIAWPRQALYYELFVRCPQLSLPQIGKVMGGRDHSTIHSGINAYCKRRGLSYEGAMLTRLASPNAGAYSRSARLSSASFARKIKYYGHVMREAM